MSFELWLFSIKRFAQTMDAAMLIYEALSDEAKADLQKEYKEFLGEDASEESAPDITLRSFSDKDLSKMVKVWNEVVEEGISFPQEEAINIFTAKELFKSQSYTCVAECDKKIVGIYILHPNNVGRCGHICNASFAVSSEYRGKHIGEALVKDCIAKAKELGFKILQFNAVVESNAAARHLYEKLGFVRIGTIPGGFRMKDGSYENICPYYYTIE